MTKFTFGEPFMWMVTNNCLENYMSQPLYSITYILFKSIFFQIICLPGNVSA